MRARGLGAHLPLVRCGEEAKLLWTLPAARRGGGGASPLLPQSRGRCDSARRLRAAPRAGQRLCIPGRISVCGLKSWDRQGRHRPVNTSDPEDLSRPVRHLHRPCQLRRLHQTFADKLPDLVLQPQSEIYGELSPFLGFMVRRPMWTWSGRRASRWKPGLGLGDC